MKEHHHLANSETLRFGFLTAATVKITVSLDVTPCFLANICRHFDLTCYLHLQLKYVPAAWCNIPEEGSNIQYIFVDLGT
jgi:hypothetical protein